MQTSTASLQTLKRASEKKLVERRTACVHHRAVFFLSNSRMHLYFLDSGVDRWSVPRTQGSLIEGAKVWPEYNSKRHRASELRGTRTWPNKTPQAGSASSCSFSTRSIKRSASAYADFPHASVAGRVYMHSQHRHIHLASKWRDRRSTRPSYKACCSSGGICKLAILCLDSFRISVGETSG